MKTFTYDCRIKSDLEDDEKAQYMIKQCLENRSGLYENYLIKRQYMWI